MKAEEEREVVKQAVLCLARAVGKFYKDDMMQLWEYKKTLKGIERACAFRIGSYFREMAKSPDFKVLDCYDVDMEFNRQWKKGDADNEQAAVSKAITINGKPKNIVPDLILHKRQSGENILACEFKTSGGKKSHKKDITKLEWLTTSRKDDEYTGNYRLGAFVRLSESQDKNGEVMFFQLHNEHESNQGKLPPDTLFNQYCFSGDEQDCVSRTLNPVKPA